MFSLLTILALYGLLVMAVLVAQVLATATQVPLRRLVGNRADMPALTGLAGRLDRARANSLVARALVAPALIILEMRDGGARIELAVLLGWIFLAARLVYVLVYAAGIPWLRTLVWGVGFVATGWLYVMAL